MQLSGMALSNASHRKTSDDSDMNVSMKRRARAVSTGEAASYCFVTSDTIVNWIKSGLIRAQRTAGGQYRILVHHLREFMEERKMDTGLLDHTYDLHRFCWQYRSDCSRNDEENQNCDDCLVKFLGALNCYRFMRLRMSTNGRERDCANCDYFNLWGQSETGQSDEGEERS